MNEEPFIYTRLLGQHGNYDERRWGEESYSAGLKIGANILIRKGSGMDGLSQ